MTKTKLFSKTVSLIYDLEEGKKKGNYSWIYDWITPDHVPLSEKLPGEKKVYLVPLDETITTEEIPAWLTKQGLKPCQNAPEYLLGLIAVTPESEFPEELKYKDLVAGNTASVFANEVGGRCFLFVFRDGGVRELRLVPLDGFWRAGDDWVFLAEDLDTSETSDLSLISLDTLTLEQAIKICKDAGIKLTREKVIIEEL